MVVVGLLRWAASAVYDLVWKQPLRELFMFGPQGWFWAGASDSDMCYGMSTMPASFWLDNPEACQELISRNFETFHRATTTVAYFASLLLLGVYATRQGCRCRRRRPPRPTTTKIILLGDPRLLLSGGQ